MFRNDWLVKVVLVLTIAALFIFLAAHISVTVN